MAKDTKALADAVSILLSTFTDQNNPIAQLLRQARSQGGLSYADVARVQAYFEQAGKPLPPQFASVLTAEGQEAPGAAGGYTPPQASDNPNAVAQNAAAAAANAARQAMANNGGISSENDNGVGGGGPAGAAAEAAAAQQARQAAGQAGLPGSAVAAPQGPQGPAGGGGGGGNQPYSGAQGDILSQDDDQLVRFALKAAGMDPDHMNNFTRIAGKALVPLLRARRAAFGIAGDSDVQGLPQDIASFAQEYTNKGANFFQNARGYAQQALGSDNFKNAVAGLGDQDQVAALFQSLMPLQYAGSNPLIQQAAADTFNRQQNQYNDTLFNNSGNTTAMPGGQGLFLDWLNAQQNIDPITRRIFGLK